MLLSHVVSGDNSHMAPAQDRYGDLHRAYRFTQEISDEIQASNNSGIEQCRHQVCHSIGRLGRMGV